MSDRYVVQQDERFNFLIMSIKKISRSIFIFKLFINVCVLDQSEHATLHYDENNDNDDVEIVKAFCDNFVIKI